MCKIFVFLSSQELLYTSFRADVLVDFLKRLIRLISAKSSTTPYLHVQSQQASNNPWSPPLRKTPLRLVSKLMEKVVMKQLNAHLEGHDMCEPQQSAYRSHHYTETTMVKVISNLLLVTVTGNIKSDNAKSKAAPPYDPKPLVVTERKGFMSSAERNGRRVTRNSSFFKPSPKLVSDAVQRKRGG